MKIGIMQPYFLPYIGYFQLINAVDVFVVYDDVTYIKGGWINRNNFLINGEKKLFTINIRGLSSYKFINEIEILDDFNNLIKTIQINYAKAPYFEKIMELIKEVIIYDKCNLALFITNSIKIILEYLHIDTKLVLSSSLNKDSNMKGKEKVFNICKLLDAADYYNAIGGVELYHNEEFKNNGITLNFLKSNIIPYKQFKNIFVPDLSIIDVMMFNSVEEIRTMLDRYELVTSSDDREEKI